MGDSQVARWLSKICEIEYNIEQKWHHLIKFLERDLKVQQQKLLIQNKSENKRQKQAKKKGMLEDITATSLVTQIWNQSVVFVKKLRSIATIGPKGTKILQYFAC